MVGICATSYFFGDNLVTWPRHLGSVVSSGEVCAQPKPGCEFWLQKEEGETRNCHSLKYQAGSIYTLDACLLLIFYFPSFLVKAIYTFIALLSENIKGTRH